MRVALLTLAVALLPIQGHASSTADDFVSSLNACLKFVETGKAGALGSWVRAIDFQNDTELCEDMASCDGYFEIVLDGPAAGSDDLIEVEFGAGILPLHCGTWDEILPPPDGLGAALEGFFAEAFATGRLVPEGDGAIETLGCAYDGRTFEVLNDFADFGAASFLVDLGPAAERKACR